MNQHSGILPCLCKLAIEFSANTSQLPVFDEFVLFAKMRRQTQTEHFYPVLRFTKSPSLYVLQKQPFFYQRGLVVTAIKIKFLFVIDISRIVG